MTITVKLKVKHGESLHSFLLRSAESNGMNLFELINPFRKNLKYRLHKGDIHRIDFCPSNVFNMETICQLSSSTVNEINQASFSNVIDTFRGESNKEYCNFLNEMFVEQLYFCPDCYKESKQNKLIWKVADITMCVQHMKTLISECQKCRKKLFIKDLLNVGICPYCNDDLSRQRGLSIASIDDELLSKQIWLNNNWLYLTSYSGDNIMFSSEIALRLLYVLSDFQSFLNKNVVRKKLSEMTFLHYLQCARGTCKKRTIHLSSIMLWLYTKKVDVEYFLQMSIPDEFIMSVMKKNKDSPNHLCCVAPWCKSFQQQNSLIATSTKNTKKGGESLRSYMICKYCGCEYAVDSNNRLVERTHFIKGYETLSNSDLSRLTWPEREKIMGLKRSRIRRMIAYFSSRNLFMHQEVLTTCKIDHQKLALLIRQLRRGETIYNIQHWKSWCNDDEYILHRYHPDVIVAICETYYQNEKALENAEDLQMKIHTVCKKLLDTETNITLPAVSKAIALSVTTIQNKGLAAVVAKYKRLQSELQKQKLKIKITKTIECMSGCSSEGWIYAAGIYKRIGVCRSTLKKIDPSLCLQVDSLRKKMNIKIINKRI